MSPEPLPPGVPKLAGTTPIVPPEILSPSAPIPAASIAEIKAASELIGNIVSPLADAQKHAANQQLEGMRVQTAAAQKTWFSLVGLLSLITVGAVVLAFKGEPNGAREILIALISLLGGIGIGWASHK